jgi:hypothetical protein
MNTTLTGLPYLWEQRDVEDLASSRDFNHIGEIVLKVLLRSTRSVTMVSGPITSGGTQCKNQNLERYRKAMKFVASQGKHVFNQLPGEQALKKRFDHWMANRQNEADYCWPLLEGVYAPLFTSGRVERLAFMPNWHTSTGSKWEHDMASHYDISIEYLPGNWEDLYEAVA